MQDSSDTFTRIEKFCYLRIMYKYIHLCVVMYEDRPQEVIEKEFELMDAIELATSELLTDLPISSSVVKGLLDNGEHLRKDKIQRKINFIKLARQKIADENLN